MTTRIAYDVTTKQLSKLIAIAVDRLADARAEFERIKLSIDAAQTGGGGFADLGAELGATPSDAQALWTIFSNANDVLNGNTFVRVDTKTGKQALDELISRLDQG